MRKARVRPPTLPVFAQYHVRLATADYRRLSVLAAKLGLPSRNAAVQGAVAEWLVEYEPKAARG